MNDLTEVFRYLVELAGIRELSEFFATLQGQDLQTTLSVVGVFTLIFGVLQCFFGYKLIKIWCAFVGFLLGCAGGIIIAAMVSASVQTPIYIVLLIIFTVGLLCGLLAHRLYIVGVFIYAFAAAFMVGFALVSLITDSVYVGLIVGLLAGIAMGVVAVLFKRAIIIVATSVYGGVTAGAGFMMIIQNTDPLLGFIIPAVFIIAGLFVQFKTVGKEAGKPAKAAAATAATAAPPGYPAAPPQGFARDPYQSYIQSAPTAPLPSYPQTPPIAPPPQFTPEPPIAPPPQFTPEPPVAPPPPYPPEPPAAPPPGSGN